MFSKFLVHEAVGTQSEVRSSQRRTYLKQIKEQYPKLDGEQLEILIPKKALKIAKCPERINVLISGTTNQPLFSRSATARGILHCGCCTFLETLCRS